MRFTLGATIVLMGALGLLLALTTGEVYQRQALENQRSTLQELVRLSASEQLHDLEGRARDLGLALQNEPGFQRAWSADRPALARELLLLLRPYRTSAALIHLDRVEAHSRERRLLAAVSTAAVLAKARAGVCPELFAVPAAGSDARSADRALCRNSPTARLAVRVPVTTHPRGGDLVIVTDPMPVLARIEQRLGVPVRMHDADDERLFASETWPPPSAMQNALVAEYALTTPAGEPVLKVAIMRDIEPLRDQLRETRLIVMTIAAMVTLLGMFVAGYVLEKTALEPLNALTRHLQRVSTDKGRLGESVPVGGIAEIRELAEDFNQMTRELDQLYGSLEHMAFTDPLTNLPNRARFRDTLEEAARAHARAQEPFALFLMDLDRFKAVNDTHGHPVGDLLLQEVSTRLRSVLRGSDTIARVDSETIEEMDTKMVARLGGDEFAAILPRISGVDDATRIAHKLLLVMQEPFSVHGHNLSVGISIGIAFYPQHGTDIDTLIQRADAAMYSAKHNQIGLAFAETMQQNRLI